MLEIIKFGDREGNGAVVKKSGWFRTTTWTANNDNELFPKWVCLETGAVTYKSVCCDIDYFYKAQFDTQN